MSRPHDLGGIDGFGPVDVDAPPFSHEWESRQWALSRNVPIRAGTIDWWRHGIENMAPEVYRAIPYFEKWCLNDLAQGIDAGIFTMDELLNGVAQPGSSAPVRSLNDLHESLRLATTDFSRPVTTPATYRVGDTVRTKSVMPEGHTRLPRYAMGKFGTIIAHHGGHLFPDSGALGIEQSDHLYTVEFDAKTLWDTSADDSVCIDLWESYFDAS